MTDFQTSLEEERSDTAMAVGADIRALRKSRGVTLSDMATHLDRSIGWLSQIERGQAEPPIAELRKIARMFEIPISFFFRNEMSEEDELGLVVRSDSRASLGSRRGGLTEELLSPNLSGDFEMIRSEFEPRSKSDWIEPRPTNEGGYVISGNLSLYIGGASAEKKFNLSAGDSFQFENESYAWENESDEPAVVIWVISPPVY